MGRINHWIGKAKAIYGFMRAPVTLSSKVFGPHLGPLVAAAIGLGAVGGAATVGTLVITGGPTFEAGDSGLYYAPESIPAEQIEGDHTLEVVFGATVVDSISITDATSGRSSGITEAIRIGGGGNYTLSTNTLVLDGLSCTKLTITGSTIHTLILEDNLADGNDFVLTFGAAPPPGIVPGPSSPRGLVTTGSQYDMIKIEASAVDGKVGSILIKNVKTFGAPCIVESMKIGTMTVRNSLFGSGDGLAAKDFIVASSTTVDTFTDTNNLEVTLDVVE